MTSPHVTAAVSIADLLLAPALSTGEVVFIADDVPHAKELASLNSTSGREVVLLDAKRDALTQMAQALQGRSGLQALHWVGHGSEGALSSGTDSLTMNNIGLYQATLTTIGSALAPDGDWLIYGCNVAGNENGQHLLQELGRLSQADVAASTNVTGAASLQGDWTLEWQQGAIDTLTLGAVTGVTDVKTALFGWDFFSLYKGTSSNDNAVRVESTGSFYNYLYGYDGNDRLEMTGDVRQYFLFGGNGNDTLIANNSDILYGEDGNDVLSSISNSRPFGGNGNDTITVTGYGNWLRGEGGNDTLHGGSDGSNTLTGGDGNDVLTVTGGNNTLEGDSGSDTIQGASGNDKITLFSGTLTDLDVITTGTGNDVIALNGSVYAGQATVTDFSGSNDLIQLTSFGDVDAFTSNYARFVIHGAYSGERDR